MTPEELHQRLLDPHAYPSPPGTIELRETHASCVYLTDKTVYKVKKPVNIGFLDFSTLELRHHFCLQEVLLNRRFAPNTYLGVVPIRLHHGQLFIDGQEGEIVEYAVVMRRLPEERMLDRLVERNDPSLPDEVVRLGTSLAQMHKDCQICRGEIEDAATVVQRNWEENFNQTEHYAGVTINRDALNLLRERMHLAIDNLSRQMREREEAGRVRDGHGDLHADHICLTYPICIYDCIEFNRRFRVGDILADLAFLLMDLDKRGKQDLARIIEKTWSSLLGEEIDPALLRFYEIYRAFVRGKVNSFLVDDPELPGKERAVAAVRAKEYFDLALGYLVPPTLFITCGAMGVGKTTLSRALAFAVRGTHLRSDIVRKELFGIDLRQHRPERFGQGLYDPARSRQTYDQLLKLTSSEIAAGHTVIVDAAFADREERQRFRQLATAAGIPFVLLYLHCDEELTRQRLAQRWDEGADPSDGRPEILQQQLRSFTHPVAGENAISIDTGKECHDNVQKILVNYLAKR
jgi:aminoglycoside phosphotransferase family enzyme/predicted kinase